MGPFHSPARFSSARTETLVPKKRRQHPTHSRLGNPYPVGLSHVVMDGPPGSTDLEQPWAGMDYDPGVAADDYLYEQPDPKWPRLKLYLAPRRRRETEEQYEGYRRGIERCTCLHAIYLGLCQLLSTHLGSHWTCAEGACRRNGCCVGIRDQDYYSLPLLVYPPCVPLDREITETCRMEIIAEMKRVVARGNEARPKAEPATAGRRRVGP